MIKFVLKILRPEKYKQKCLASKIVDDCKVYRKGVEIYKDKIRKGKNMRPVVLVKHPKKDFYTILDGHHRFQALVENGSKEIECAVIKTRWKIIFDAVKEGLLQPNPWMTKYIHMPIQRIFNMIENFFRKKSS